MALLTENQEIALSLITFIPAILSILGSSTIIYLTIHEPRKANGVYNRLLLGLSIMDCINTTALVLQPFLVPQAGGRVFAIGNYQSCQAMGFFSQLGISASLYNASLALYFLLIIFFRCPDTRLVWIEPLMHVSSAIFPLITASAYAAFGMYAETELGMFCMIDTVPEECLGVDTGGGGTYCLGRLFQFAFTGIPSTFSLLLMVASNLLIYCKVRHAFRNVKQIRRYWFSQQRGSNNRASSSTPHEIKKRDVGIQSFLYVTSSINTLTWFMFLTMNEGNSILGPLPREEESSVFWLLIMVQLTYPSQGFFNVLIYLRPRYLRWRRRFPEESRRWCIQKVLSHSSLHPRRPSQDNQNMPSLHSSAFDEVLFVNFNSSGEDDIVESTTGTTKRNIGDDLSIEAGGSCQDGSPDIKEDSKAFN